MFNLIINLIWENYNFQVESEVTVYHQGYSNLPYLITEIYLNLEKSRHPGILRAGSEEKRNKCISIRRQRESKSTNIRLKLRNRRKIEL